MLILGHKNIFKRCLNFMINLDNTFYFFYSYIWFPRILKAYANFYRYLKKKYENHIFFTFNSSTIVLN